MQWKVTANGKNTVIELPDVIPNNIPFAAKIAGRPCTLLRQRHANSLLIKANDTNVWSTLALRSTQVQRFVGEQDWNVTAEFLPSGVQSPVVLDATVGLHLPGQEGRTGAQTKKAPVIRAQMTGKVLKVFAMIGKAVEPGEAVLVIEAMKMENRVLAASGGVVERILVNVGDMVSSGAELIRFKES